MRGLRRIGPCLLTVGLLLGLSLPAQASLEDNLSPFPDDAQAVISFSLNPADWPYLLARLDRELNRGFVSDVGRSKNVLKLPAEVGPILQILDSELKFDPLFDGLQSLGSHLTLGWLPKTGTEGTWLFSLNLRDPERIAKLLVQLKNYLQTDSTSPYRFQSFGGQDYFTYALPSAGGHHTGKQLLLTVSGQNLIGSLGPDSAQLERMLYTEMHLPRDSRFRLVNLPGFAAVRRVMSARPLWAYVALEQNLGLSLVLGDKGIQLEALLSPLAANQTSSRPEQVKIHLAELTTWLTGRSSQTLDLYELRQKLQPGDSLSGPVLLSLLPDWDLLDKQLLAEIDTALEPLQSIDVSRQQIADGTHYLFDFKIRMKQLPLTPRGLSALGADIREVGSQAAVRSNMRKLRRLLGTDTADLTKLENEAGWQQIFNPYTQQSGSPAAIMHLNDYRPGPEMAGKVFYCPEASGPSSGSAPRYWIYGADGLGNLLQDQEGPLVLTNS